MSRRARIQQSLPFVIPAMTFLIGLLLSSYQSKIGVKPFLGAALIILLCGIVCFFFFYFISKNVSAHFLTSSKKEFCSYCRTQGREISALTTELTRCKQILDKFDREVSHYIYVNKDISLKGVVTGVQLADIEAELPSDAIVWVITATLIEENPDEIFHSVVGNNLSKGIKYIYFVPSWATLDAHIKRISDSHKKFSDNLRFITLPENFFLLYPYLDLAIYNPSSSDKRSAYIQLPTQEEMGGPLFASVDDAKYINGILRRLEKYV